MDCLPWFRKNNSFEDLKRRSKQTSFKVEKIRRSKVNMRRLIKGNSPFIWFIGPPGVGRKSLAKAIADAFEFPLFDVMDLLSLEAEKQTPRGKTIALILMKKKKLPTLLLLDILKEAMAEKAEDCNNPQAWLVSGFPFYLEEAFRFEAEVGRVGLVLCLLGNVRAVAGIIKRSYQKYDHSIPRNLTQRLTVYMEQMKPLISLYSDRLERVEITEELYDVFCHLYQIIVSFEMAKPTNNKPSAAAFQKLRRYQREHPFLETGHMSSRSFWHLTETSFRALSNDAPDLSKIDVMQTSQYADCDVTPPLQRLNAAFSRPSMAKDRVPGL